MQDQGRSPLGRSPQQQQQQDLPPESLPLLASPPSEGQGQQEREQEPPSLSLGQCLAGLDFWLLLGIHLVCSGAGLTLLNNVNQMVGPSGAAWVTHFHLSIFTSDGLTLLNNVSQLVAPSDVACLAHSHRPVHFHK